MKDRFVLIGAPSSAGAYAPGPEKTPAALREAGLLDLLGERGLAVEDRGDVEGFRWRVDRDSPRAMNAAVAARVATDTAARVAAALGQGAGPGRRLHGGTRDRDGGPGGRGPRGAGVR